MLKRRIFKYTLVLIIAIASTFIFFTDVYLNTFPSILRSIVGADKIQYSTIDGNLIRGFEIRDVLISDSKYNLKSKKINIDLTFSDIFKGFSRITHLKLENGHLQFDDIYGYFNNSDSDYNNIDINNIDLVNFDILLDEGKISCYEVRLSFILGEIASIEGNAALFLPLDYVFNSDNISIKLKEDRYQYSFSLNDLNFENIAFKGIQFFGDFHSIDNINSRFNISEIQILNERFSSLSGALTYIDSKILISMPSEFENMEESLIGGEVEIQDSLVNAMEVIFKIKNSEPLFMKNQELFIQDKFYGQNVRLDYRQGSLLAKDFSITSFNEYEFDILFKDFDIRLFRGLDARGLLSGSLYISDNEWIAKSDTEISNFRYGKYEIDKIHAEREFSSKDFSIDDLKFSKQKIGFLDISSIYNEIIHKLLERYEIKKIEF